jgi:hypothetical protein
MLALQVEELFEHRSESNSSNSLGLSFGGFFLGFFLTLRSFSFLFRRVATLHLPSSLYPNASCSSFCSSFLSFLFMGFDILCLFLGLRLCFLLTLVCTNCNGIGSFLTEHVGKKGGCKMGLVVLFVISHPHTLPLLWD